MAHHQGEVRGKVAYREGDGVEIAIPLGPCELEVTELDVTFSWHDVATRGSAAIPVADYSRYVAEGALKVQ